MARHVPVYIRMSLTVLFLFVSEMKKLKKIGEGVYGEVFLRKKGKLVSVIKVGQALL